MSFKSDYDKNIIKFLMFNENNFCGVNGKSIDLILVDEDDADFIYFLRSNSKKNKYLNISVDSVEKQRDWIKNYKMKEKNQLEFYFKIISNNKKVGVVRIYDLKDDSFCWGSWIILDDAPKTVALESTLMIYEFGFNVLGFNNCHFDVRKLNKKVVQYHKSYGAKIVGESDLDYFFIFTKNDYKVMKKKFLIYL